MLGFTDKITTIVQTLRVVELQLSRLFRRLVCLRVFLGNWTSANNQLALLINYSAGSSTMILAPLMTFAVFVLSARSTGQTLDTASAYTAVSLIALVGSPLEVFIQTIPMMTASLACFSRIQSFLASDARNDLILPLDNSSFSTQQSTMSTHQGGIEMQNLSKPQNHQESIIDVKDASFAWTKNGDATINDVSFSVSRQQFVFIIGPVGCGKSTLMKGLLGETPSIKGFVYSNLPEIAYVDQTPWIQNMTIQQNILGISSFEEPWYSQVVQACALEHDILKLPNGNGMRSHKSSRFYRKMY